MLKPLERFPVYDAVASRFTNARSVGGVGTSSCAL